MCSPKPLIIVFSGIFDVSLWGYLRSGCAFACRMSWLYLRLYLTPIWRLCCIGRLTFLVKYSWGSTFAFDSIIGYALIFWWCCSCVDPVWHVICASCILDLWVPQLGSFWTLYLFLYFLWISTVYQHFGFLITSLCYTFCFFHLMLTWL